MRRPWMWFFREHAYSHSVCAHACVQSQERLFLRHRSEILIKTMISEKDQSMKGLKKKKKNNCKLQTKSCSYERGQEKKENKRLTVHETIGSQTVCGTKSPRLKMSSDSLSITSLT